MRSIIWCSKGLMAATVLALFLLQSCGNGNNGKNKSDSLAIKEKLGEAPVTLPREAIKKMHVEEGFDVKLVAAEPMIAAPVALTFDEKGRIWVIDMQDYMPDTAGRGEGEPTGKVVILSDTDSDGTMDKSKIFLDSLVLPRAI